jgi:hypothetical protein
VLRWSQNRSQMGRIQFECCICVEPCGTYGEAPDGPWCILARTARVMLPVSRKLRLLDSMKRRGSALCKITGHMLTEHRAGKPFTSNSMTQYTSCLTLHRYSLLQILLPRNLALDSGGSSDRGSCPYRR